MAGSTTNPDNVWGPNQYSAQRVSLSPGLGIPKESGGLTFDRAQFESVMGTKSGVSNGGNASQAKPV